MLLCAKFCTRYLHYSVQSPSEHGAVISILHVGKMTPKGDSGHMSKLLRLEEGQLGVQASPDSTCPAVFFCVMDVCNPGPPQLPGEEQLDTERS